MSLQTVITSDQARQITGGRKPLVPVEYETAIKSLAACLSLDDAKTWDAKADALSAWAKIYRDDEVGRKAKALKLHAYRRMGQLAAEINPSRRNHGEGSGRGSVVGSGPRTELKSHGLTVAQTDAAMTISKLSERRFQQVLKNPVSPTTLRYSLRDSTIWHFTQASMQSCRSRFRSSTPAQTVASMSEVERQNALALVKDMTEWLDEFETRLNK